MKAKYGEGMKQIHLAIAAVAAVALSACHPVPEVPRDAQPIPSEREVVTDTSLIPRPTATVTPPPPRLKLYETGVSNIFLVVDQKTNCQFYVTNLRGQASGSGFTSMTPVPGSVMGMDGLCA